MKNKEFIEILDSLKINVCGYGVDFDVKAIGEQNNKKIEDIKKKLRTAKKLDEK